MTDVTLSRSTSMFSETSVAVTCGGSGSLSNVAQIESTRQTVPRANGLATVDSRGRYVAVRSDHTEVRRFQRLTKEWKSHRNASSSVFDIVCHPAYRKIVRMGERAIPLILRELRSEGNAPHPWFPALHEITGEQPIKNDGRGITSKMAQAWLEWGERKGYVR